MDIKNTIPVLRSALQEDIGAGDITTRTTVPGSMQARAIIIAKASGVLAGLDIAKEVFELVDKRIKIKFSLRDGARIKKGAIIACVSGPARGILTAERTALNFLEHLSGIATLTWKIKERVKGCEVSIMDTRKTLPGLRLLEKYAVKVGGGRNHRMGLWDMVLIKDNHIKAGDRVKGIGDRRQGIGYRENKIKEMVKMAREKAPKGMKIEIEVNSLREFKAALEAKPDIIMLDNMNVRAMKNATKLRNAFLSKPYTLNPVPLLEASGNVTLKNVRKIAAAGVDIISIGALTHSSHALDMSLEIG